MKLILIVLFFTFSIFVQENIDAYYNALSSEEVSVLDTQITYLNELKVSSQTNAYLGALVMKRSSFESTVKDKIDMFKKGHKLLESEIEKIPANTEYRFLRLAVQENAPSILGYNSDLVKDKLIILKNYSSLSSNIKKHIDNYCAISDILSLEELK